MTNLYDETVEILKSKGKTIADIDYIGSSVTKINTNKALELMKKTNYDRAFGYQEVAKNLIVIGFGFILERGEHTGSEWWIYRRTYPCYPEVDTDVTSLASDRRRENNLEKINGLHA